MSMYDDDRSPDHDHEDYTYAGEDDHVGGSGQYPGGDPTLEGRDDGTCLSCGKPLPSPTAQRRCDDCRSDTPSPDLKREITQLQFAVVPGTSKYLAAAKGGAALRHSERTSRVDTIRPVYSFAAEVPSLLEERWGDLPRVVELTSDRGQALVETALGDHDGDSSDVPLDADRIPFFVDAVGDAIDVDGRGSDLDAATATLQRRALEGAPTLDTDDLDIGTTANSEGDGDQDEDLSAPSVWLMPAWVLTQPSSDVGDDSPLKTTIDCASCGGTPLHRYLGVERTPAESGYRNEPLWECQRCGRRRSGPTREAVEQRQDRSLQERLSDQPASIEEPADWDTEPEEDPDWPPAEFQPAVEWRSLRDEERSIDDLDSVGEGSDGDSHASEERVTEGDQR